MDVAKNILRTAYKNGITFFASARAYSDSEEKICEVFSSVRDNICIDIYQFHNPVFCLKAGDGSGLYDTLQFSFNYLASKKEEMLVKLCKE